MAAEGVVMPGQVSLHQLPAGQEAGEAGQPGSRGEAGAVSLPDLPLVAHRRGSEVWPAPEATLEERVAAMIAAAQERMHRSIGQRFYRLKRQLGV